LYRLRDITSDKSKIAKFLSTAQGVTPSEFREDV